MEILLGMQKSSGLQHPMIHLRQKKKKKKFEYCAAINESIIDVLCRDKAHVIQHNKFRAPPSLPDNDFLYKNPHLPL